MSNEQLKAVAHADGMEIESGVVVGDVGVGHVLEPVAQHQVASDFEEKTAVGRELDGHAEIGGAEVIPAQEGGCGA
jgi:hypothetical protein